MTSRVEIIERRRLRVGDRELDLATLVPEGGGYFYVLPGVESHDRYLGDTLLEG